MEALLHRGKGEREAERSRAANSSRERVQGSSQNIGKSLWISNQLPQTVPSPEGQTNLNEL